MHAEFDPSIALSLGPYLYIGRFSARHRGGWPIRQAELPLVGMQVQSAGSMPTVSALLFYGSYSTPLWRSDRSSLLAPTSPFASALP